MTSPTILIKRVTGQIATHLGVFFILLASALVAVGAECLTHESLQRLPCIGIGLTADLGVGSGSKEHGELLVNFAALTVSPACT